MLQSLLRGPQPSSKRLSRGVNIPILEEEGRSVNSVGAPMRACHERLASPSLCARGRLDVCASNWLDLPLSWVHPSWSSEEWPPGNSVGDAGIENAAPRGYAFKAGPECTDDT